MTVCPCPLPAVSGLDRAFVEAAFFSDAYQVPLAHAQASVVDVFFAVFGHHPGWLKALLLVRRRLGRWIGLGGATTAEILRPARRASYRVGENIGRWPIFRLVETELIAGRDDKHLDFRVSVLKQGSGNSACAIISTVCRAHNRYGRLYLRVVAPLHTRGMQRLLRRASEAGRL